MDRSAILRTDRRATSGDPPFVVPALLRRGGHNRLDTAKVDSNHRQTARSKAAVSKTGRRHRKANREKSGQRAESEVDLWLFACGVAHTGFPRHRNDAGRAGESQAFAKESQRGFGDSGVQDAGMASERLGLRGDKTVGAVDLHRDVVGGVRGARVAGQTRVVVD